MGDKQEPAVITMGQMETAISRSVASSMAEWAKNYKPELPNQPKADMAQGSSLIPDITVQGKVVAPETGLVIAKQMGIASLVDAGDGIKVPFLNVALPVVSAVAGTGLGIVAGNVVDRYVPSKWANIGTHLAVAGLAYKASEKIGVRTAGAFFAGSILMRLALNYTPVGTLFGNLEESLTKTAAKFPRMQQGGYQQSAASYAQAAVQQQGAAQQASGWSSPAYQHMGVNPAFS